MAYVNYGPLDLATSMLRSRLAQRMPIGVNIIPAMTAELPSDINEHPGRYVGFFIWLERDLPSFVWLSRSQPGFGFTHIHVYYPGGSHREMPERERARFAAKRLAPHVQYCVVNLKSQVPRLFHISLLLSALEVTLMSQRLA